MHKTAVIDGVDTSQMSREQLEKFAHNIRNEMEREREERNFFQLERDKLRTFWEITRTQLEEARMQLRAKDRDVELAQEHAECDIKHNTQQMKHLQYENQTRMGEIRAETMTQLKMAQEDHSKQELDLLNDKRELRRQLREAEEMTEMQMQQLKMKHSEHLCTERTRYMREADEMKRLHEQKLQEYIEESEIRHRMEMAEVEERKSEQIAKLLAQHEKAFKEIRNYYNELTLNNLALISTLKEQMEELRDHADKSEKNMSVVMAENKRLTGPMKKAQLELTEMRKKCENYDRDRAALKRTTSAAQSSSKQLSELKWEAETLRMRCDALTEERDTLNARFEKAVMDLQQKTAMKNVLLERRLTLANTEAEKREVVLGEVLHAAGMEPHALGKKMETLIKTKNDTIQDLKYELARVCKAHDDLLVTYEAKMVQFGIPVEELGFQPIRTTGQMRLGAGPAGLVTKPL